MDTTAITADIRRGCRNPRLSSSDIAALILRGVTHLGYHIRSADPSHFIVRKSLTSLTHIFDRPSDCNRVINIWDLGTTANSVTGAADNGSGLVRITVANHGFADDAIVTQHDIGGTTVANGTFKITYVDANSYDLQGSTFAGVYTSGGYAYETPNSPTKINRMIIGESSLDSSFRWYPRGGKIIIDDDSFTNDILIDYDAEPDALADIPSQFHDGIVAFGVIKLIRVPRTDDPSYYDIMESKNFHGSMLKIVVDQIGKMKPSTEPEYIRNVW